MHRNIASVVVAVALVPAVIAATAQAAVPKLQESRFAALRQAPVRSVPADVARFAGDTRVRPLGLAVSETRRVAAPGGGSWDVIPGADGICLFVEREQTGTCASTADALAGRLGAQFVAPGARHALPGLPFDVPTDTARYRAGLLPDEAVSVTAASASGGGLLARPDGNGLYRLSSSAGVIGTPTMHRAGRRSLPITGARKGIRTSARAHAASCTPGLNCYCDSIPQGYGNQCLYGGSYSFAFFGAQWGRWLHVRSVQVLSDDTNTICGNALNQDNTWAGSFFCNTSRFTYNVHLYAGTVRIAYAGPGAPSASVLGKAYYEFN